MTLAVAATGTAATVAAEGAAILTVAATEAPTTVASTATAVVEGTFMPTVAATASVAGTGPNRKTRAHPWTDGEPTRTRSAGACSRAGTRRASF